MRTGARRRRVLLGLCVAFLLALLVAQLPAVKSEWRAYQIERHFRRGESIVHSFFEFHSIEEIPSEEILRARREFDEVMELDANHALALESLIWLDCIDKDFEMADRRLAHLRRMKAAPGIIKDSEKEIQLHREYSGSNHKDRAAPRRRNR